MQILLSNENGGHAKGLRCLSDAVRGGCVRATLLLDIRAQKTAPYLWPRGLQAVPRA